jgi:hypothetical protein
MIAVLRRHLAPGWSLLNGAFRRRCCSQVRLLRLLRRYCLEIGGVQRMDMNKGQQQQCWGALEALVTMQLRDADIFTTSASHCYHVGAS